MYFDVYNYDFDKDIIPFIKNGIILDTSVIKIFLDGLIGVRISKKPSCEFYGYDQLLSFFDLLKIQDKFDRFLITPHILTEVCNHVRNDHSKKSQDFKPIFEEISPFLNQLIEKNVTKAQIFKKNDANKPIEIGDLSIFVVADEYINARKKIAILAKDHNLNSVYSDNSDILVMDFQAIINNLV